MEDRIAAIETAHRALTARHEALFQTAKVMFALMPVNAPLLAKLLDRTERIMQAHMERLEWDAEFRADVTEAMHELREVIRAAEGRHANA